MADEKVADLTPKVTPLEPGEPVEATAFGQMGGTFAERAAASRRAASKAVGGDDAENKAVGDQATARKSRKS